MPTEPQQGLTPLSVLPEEPCLGAAREGAGGLRPGEPPPPGSRHNQGFLQCRHQAGVGSKPNWTTDLSSLRGTGPVSATWGASLVGGPGMGLTGDMARKT